MERTARFITAQVAVEAVINDPTGYDAETIEAVRKEGEEVGVADFYMTMIPATNND